MSRLSPQGVAAIKSLLWGGFTAILAALLAALLAWYVTSRTNAQMAFQQQEMEAISQFDSTGADLDSDMSDFIDSLVDGEVKPEIRKSLRTAISLHAAKSQRLAQIIGPKTIEEYTAGLGRLRVMADKTSDVSSGMVAAQLHSNILVNKKRVSDAAWRKITDQ